MLTIKSNYSLTRRDSKLLVQVVIGIIGILGIMFAQLGEINTVQMQQAQNNGKVISSEISRVSSNVDWLEILF